jgi:hypothetical protein
MRIAALAGLMTLALACSQAGLAEPRPEAASPPPLPLALAGTGPYYLLNVSMAARQASGRLDLSDLRVRNAAGDAMAFAWAQAPTPAPDPQRVPVRIYKVPLPPADAASSIGGRPRQAWIVDTREARLDLMQLDLGLEPGTQGAYTLRIEASDDLQHWRTVAEDAQLVQLQALPQVGAAAALATQAGREQLKSDPIDLDAVPARYLRLTTAPRSAIPPLVTATITREPHRPAAPPLEWGAPIEATSCDTNSCEYALPRNVPIDAVQVAPTDVDTIGQVMVSGRIDASRLPPRRHSLLRGSLHALRLKANRSAERTGPVWDDVAEANVYWLTQAGGAPDLHSPPLRLGGEWWSALRLETFGPISQLGRAAPTLRIGARPRQLVFVARGPGPFVLARATPTERTAPMPLAALMPARGPEAPLPEATATVAAPVAAAAPSSPVSGTTKAGAPTSSNSPWLWAALLAGLALMGAMAWSLLRKPADGA